MSIDKSTAGSVVGGIVLGAVSEGVSMAKRAAGKFLSKKESAADQKARKQDEAAQVLAKKRARADEEKRQKKAAAQRLKDALAEDRASMRAQIKAERDAAIAARKTDAAKRLAEKRAIADERRTMAANGREAARQERQQLQLEKVEEKQTEKNADARIKEHEVALKSAQKKWAEDDAFLQGQKVVVSNPPPPINRDPLAPPQPPGGGGKKGKKKNAEDYQSETTKLLMGQVGSGGRGTLDWLREHAPGAVEARQAHNDAIDRELEKRKKSEEAATKKVSDEKEAESRRRADWQKERITGKKPPAPDPDAKQRKFMTELKMTPQQQDDFLRAPQELR